MHAVRRHIHTHFSAGASPIAATSSGYPTVIVTESFLGVRFLTIWFGLLTGSAICNCVWPLERGEIEHVRTIPYMQWKDLFLFSSWIFTPCILTALHLDMLQQFTYGVVREGVIAENIPQSPRNFRKLSAEFPHPSLTQWNVFFANFRKISAEFPQTFRNDPFANDPISELLNAGWRKERCNKSGDGCRSLCLIRAAHSAGESPIRGWQLPPSLVFLCGRLYRPHFSWPFLMSLEEKWRLGPRESTQLHDRIAWLPIEWACMP